MSFWGALRVPYKNHLIFKEFFKGTFKNTGLLCQYLPDKLFSFVPGWLSIVVAPSLWNPTMTVIIVAHEIFKKHCPLPHRLWVGPNDGNTFENALWNDSHRKISYEDSFNSVVSNVWKMQFLWELPVYKWDSLCVNWMASNMFCSLITI